jgi:hypothetical protein
LAQGLRGCRKPAVPLLNHTLKFALQSRKITENRNQVSRIMSDTTYCVDLTALLGAASTDLLGFGHLLLTVDDLRQPLVGTSTFQAAKKWVPCIS